MSEENAGSKTSPGLQPGVGARKNDPRAAERLAAALRENLRRRKTQSRAQEAPQPNAAPPNTALKEQHPALPKTPPES